MSTEEGLEARVVRFGEFEVDLEAWVLRRDGVRIGLQRKPFQILRLLIARAGLLVTRAELARALWPDLHVSYDRCLNTAVNALRRSLNDMGRTSRIIETRPGLGYRLMAEIDWGVRPQTNATEPDVAMGQYFLHRCSTDALARARASFEAVLHIDPTIENARLGLAELEITRALFGYTETRDTAERAVVHCRRALESGSAPTYGTVALAVATALGSGDFAQARAACEAFLRTGSAIGEATVRLWLAELLGGMGRQREACEQLEAARAVNPISLLVRTRLALALYRTRRFESAAEQAWAALSVEPACSEAQHALALAYQQMGYIDDAITEYQNAAGSDGGNAAALAGLCFALKEQGRSEEMALACQRFENAAAVSHVSPCWLALVAAAKGEVENAGALIRSAAATGDFVLGFVRDDPRFQLLAAAENVSVAAG